MDIFGCDLDDDLFGETKDKDQRPTLTSYNAKICPPEWFESVAPEDDSDRLNVLKFRADWAYRKGDFIAALQFYDQALGMLPSNNTSMWRDMQESSARCWIGLTQLEQALDIAHKLHRETTVNFEHKTNSLRLLMQIYKLMGDCQGVLLCILRLLILHPSEARYWIELADIYSAIFRPQLTATSQTKISAQVGAISLDNCTRNTKSETGIDDGSVKEHVNAIDASLPTSGGDLLKQVETTPEDMPAVTDDWTCTECLSTGIPIHIAVYVCLQRARILLRIMCTSAASFAREKNKLQQEQIAQRLSSISITEDLRSHCYQLARSELLKGDEGKDESPTAEILTDAQRLQMTEVDDETLQKQFEETWFEWRLTKTTS